MKRGPISYRLSPEKKAQGERIREIERRFHIRAFGEELARVNLNMTIEERHRYLARMRELARQQGVKPTLRWPYNSHLHEEEG